MHGGGPTQHPCEACQWKNNELSRLKAENERLRELVTAFRSILRHKNISPPMNPGVQDDLEQECAEALWTKQS
jgi:hypothetical protein